MDKTPVNLLQDTRRVLLNYLILVVYCSSAFVAVATCYYQMMVASDLTSFVENVTGAAGFSQVCVKLGTCIWFKDTIYNLLRDVDGFWRTSRILDVRLKESIFRTHAKTSVVLKTFIVISTATVLAVFLKPFFFERTIPVGVFSEGGSDALFLFCCVGQQISVISVWFYVPALDLIYIGVCTTIATEFEAIMDFIETIRERNDSRVGDMSADLEEFIEHHNLLLGACDKVKQIYSLIFLVQYLSGISMICCEMYMVVDVNTTITFDNICIYVFMVSQCGMYCIWAELLNTQAVAVGNAAYQCNWQENYEPTLQKALVTIIKRSQQPLRFSAFGLVDITIATFGNILKVSYSSFALLRTMKN